MAVKRKNFGYCKILLEHGCGVWNPIISAEDSGAPIYLDATYLFDECHCTTPGSNDPVFFGASKTKYDEVKRMVQSVEVKRATRRNWDRSKWSIDMPTDSS